MQRISRIVLSVFILSGLVLVPVYGQSADSGGVESLMQLDPNTPSYPYPVPGMAPYYGQPYYPYPPAPVVPAVKPEKKPWYKRLFSPLVKHASPPIDQAPRVPKDEPRETKALPEPLVRLARGFTYQGKTVPPGFYLLGLQEGSEQSEPKLLLYKQHEVVLELPATLMAPDDVSPAASSENLPSPPDKRSDGKNDRDTKPLANAGVRLAGNGRSLILVYRNKDKQYLSVPLEIAEGWLP